MSYSGMLGPDGLPLVSASDGSKGTATDTRTEREQLEDEAEQLGKDIEALTMRLNGVQMAYGRRPKGLREEMYKQIYDERKGKIERMQEIRKLAIEKGYIQE